LSHHQIQYPANQIKLIELVLSYTRKGNDFYMNHTAIADHLVIGKTVNRAKTAGNIIGQLKKKGYITTTLTHNYNGKNGGSSLTIKVDETFLEQMLQVAFNTESPEAGITPEVTSQPIPNNEPTVNPNQDFLDELEQSEEQAMAPDEVEPFNPELLENEGRTLSTPEVELLETDCSQMDEVAFNCHLKRVIRLKCMSGCMDELQMLIDNKEKWKLDFCKGGLDYLIEKVK